MTRYLCKCGRETQKSTKAETTGNRDTADCTGCPYLLPYGPMRWDREQLEYRQDVRGYECRMSQRLEYASGYIGNAASKTVLSVLSLDFDFLAQISDWICENYPGGELNGSFSRDAIRPAEYGGDGRYRMAIYCAQNRKGIAAKAALIEHFFDNHGRRRDLTPEEEKAHVLADIEAGIAQEQKGENGKVDYIISRSTDNELMYAWYRGEFWHWDPAVRRWIISQHARHLYDKHHSVFPDDSPEAFMTCSAYFDALGDYEVPYECITALLSSNPRKAQEDGTEDEAVCDSCRCPDCEDKDCPQAGCDKSDKGFGCIAPDDDCPPANPIPAAPASHADAGAATQSPSAADPASLEADPAPTAFDYSGLPDQTVSVLHLVEQEIRSARQTYICRVSAAVAAAHEELCSAGVRNSDSGKYESSNDTFISWCRSVGLSKTTAYQLLQVNALITGATLEEQAALEAASPSLLYAAAKPSAPAELVQAVKDGDITTHRQYLELLEKYKEEQKAHQAERESTSALLLDEQQRRQKAEEACIAAENKVQQYREMKDAAMETVKQQRVKTADAESRARAAERQMENANTEIRNRDAKIEELLNMSEAADRRADAAEKKARELENRPIEVAVKDPDPEVVEAKARELAAQRTAMLEAQVRSLQEDKDSALRRLDEMDNTAYLAAAEFADRAAETIDGIRTAFWALAEELSEADFFDAIAPLDEAARKIRDREWEEDEANV